MGLHDEQEDEEQDAVGGAARPDPALFNSPLDSTDSDSKSV